jgi:signal transduction histidine kinase
MTDARTRGERPAADRGGRGTRRRLLARAAEPGAGRSADVQGLLAQALEGLARETRCERAAAWARGRSGEVVALAALGDPPAPGARELALLEGLGGAADLGAAALGAQAADGPFAELARATRLAAAAPVAAGGQTLAVLVLGGPGDPPGRVRPRTLAALAAAAARLAAPLAAAAAEERLAGLGAEVRRLDRLAALGELVAEIVHEIRNPLVSVKTFLQLLPERAAEPEFQGRFREVAAEELRRIERLLDLVLAHASPDAARREDDGAELAAVCESVLQLVSHRAADLGVGVELDAPGPALRVAVSGDSLRQVVLNLVLNALDATPRGGRVRVSAAAAGGAAELRVEDEGPGVPAELRERVFEAFFSSKPDAPGGLGLAISRRIVEDAGGTIGAGESPGGGGCFQLRLPLAEG